MACKPMQGGLRLKHDRVVFYVRDLSRSLRFCVMFRGFERLGVSEGAAALTAGRTPHELLLIEMGDAPSPASRAALGLYRIGIKIGDDLSELRAATAELDREGVRIEGYERSHLKPELVPARSRRRCGDLEERSDRGVAHQTFRSLLEALDGVLTIGVHAHTCLWTGYCL